MHTRLCEQGLSIFAFDLRGFGKTALDLTHKSATSAYGKTGWSHQLDDLEWAIQHTHKEFPDLPVFLMGTSLGGGAVLGLLCKKDRSARPEASGLSGVIAGSPCLTLTAPPPKPVVWIATLIARVRPATLFPFRNKPDDLSRNSTTNAAYNADPLVRTPGSFGSLLDMINGGQKILKEIYVNWPQSMPVTSFASTTELFTKLTATDKKLILYPRATSYTMSLTASRSNL
ncbi:Alpha/Beta hydrolase protein [Mycena sp. CBHHK59/15]|nr:Alpha/Beta hydrolase protein [Mycena sp. CBHHK59/15]